MDIVTYALANKKIKAVATGIKNVEYDDPNKRLVFTTKDDTKFYVPIPDLTAGITDISVDGTTGKVIATKADGTTEEWQSCFGDSTAEKTSYTNANYTSYDNVQKALDALFSKVYYVEPKVNSFTAKATVSTSTGGTETLTGSQTLEIGRKISNIDFTWGYNKDITSQSLSNCTISIGDRSAKYTTAITGAKSFTLTAKDSENKSTSSTVSYNFYPKIYYGSASNPASYTESFIKGLSKNALQSGYKATYNFTGTGYGFFAVPASYASATRLVANIGGFDTDIDKVATISITNAYGDKRDYSLYKTDNELDAFSATFK